MSLFYGAIRSEFLYLILTGCLRMGLGTNYRPTTEGIAELRALRVLDGPSISNSQALRGCKYSDLVSINLDRWLSLLNYDLLAWSHRTFHLTLHPNQQDFRHRSSCRPSLADD